MTLLDRYIIRRFLTNFIILFILIYLLATSIDLILQLDEFMQVVETRVGADAGLVRSTITLIALAVDYHWPRIFQLFAYLLGLTCVGAMGFTLAQMHRHRELTAMLASGVSLYRVAWPLVAAAFVLNLAHIINSNLVLPRLAPLLIRGHSDLERGGLEAFPVPLTHDGRGLLLHSPAFHRDTLALEQPTFLEVDETGQTLRRTTATSAAWDEAAGGWDLRGGSAFLRSDTGAAPEEPPDPATAPRPRRRVDFIATTLGPQALIVRRYAQFAQMLSPAQIEELLATPGAVDAAELARIKYGRYSIVFSNLLMLFLTIPFFLLREPANLLRQSLLCAATALGVMLGTFIGMEVELPGIPPAAGVFLPVVVLIPMTLFSASFVRT